MVARARGKIGSTKAQRAAKGGKAAVSHDHRRVEIRLSKRSQDAVAAALRGVNAAQRTRVVDAVAAVAADAREQGERFVERNVIGNANELLAAITEQYAAADRWTELAAVWTFLAHLDVPVNHDRIARRLEKQPGDVATRYREAVRKAGEQPA